MSSSGKAEQAIRFVIFDKKNGRILQTHSRYDVEKGQEVDVPVAELLKLVAGDRYLRERVTDRDADNVDILKLEEDALLNNTVVDVRHRKIISKPLLQLKSDKREIAGDGHEQVEIQISLADDAGKALTDRNLKVKVTTTRGKLSERGGIVELKKGRGSITLTSVNETVSSVVVRATSVDGTAAPTQLVMEFV